MWGAAFESSLGQSSWVFSLGCLSTHPSTSTPAHLTPSPTFADVFMLTGKEKVKPKGSFLCFI